VQLERDGVRLHGLDFGGSGPAVLLLHGLAGHAGEWAETAGWLRERCRVVALDARGHGGSERFPQDVSQFAHAADAAHVIEALGLAPAVVVGQSLGSVAALVLAATRPELVRGLVVAEGTPDAGGEGAAAAIRASLDRWPVPLPSREAAVEHFGGASLKAEMWADGLDWRDGGGWPRFDTGVVVETVRVADSRTYWEEWERIACPILVVRGTNADALPAEHAREIVARARRATLAEIRGAGHDVHLERPDEWRRTLLAFLASLA
jgi:pimeloyl-ACP methyl ester carboxylesterase